MTDREEDGTISVPSSNLEKCPNSSVWSVTLPKSDAKTWHV